MSVSLGWFKTNRKYMAGIQPAAILSGIKFNGMAMALYQNASNYDTKEALCEALFLTFETIFQRSPVGDVKCNLSNFLVQ